MNTQRQAAFARMLNQAHQAAAKDYAVILVKDRFYKGAVDFLKGADCQHTQVLCDQINVAGHHMFFNFCCQCGARLSKFISHKTLGMQEKLSAYPVSAYDTLRTVRAESFVRLRAFYNDQWWTAYNAYLKSDHWRDLREQVLYRDGFQCQLVLYGCTQAATQVHHLTYEHVTREALSELVSVCNNCHEQHHGRRFYEEPQPE